MDPYGGNLKIRVCKLHFPAIQFDHHPHNLAQGSRHVYYDRSRKEVGWWVYNWWDSTLLWI
jgi:hypothetical protein